MTRPPTRATLHTRNAELSAENFNLKYPVGTVGTLTRDQVPRRSSVRPGRRLLHWDLWRLSTESLYAGRGRMKRIDRSLLLHMLTGPAAVVGALLWLYWRCR
jgi:hypothetical protein